MNLTKFLEQKTLFYDKIELNTVLKSYEILQKELKLPYVIHIIGTNGKGSTGRFLAHFLNKSGKTTLHYSSPHILKFNERIWINGEDVSDEKLENAHQDLQKILPSDLTKKLTYFEYTTFLALILANNYDFLVFEAGLGGEFDATSVVNRDLSLVTTIDFDHQAFLGNTIDEIAGTKIRSCKNKVILGHQIHNDVSKIAREICTETNLMFFDDNLEIPSFLDFPPFLVWNLKLACSAIKFLGFKVDFEKFADVKLFGRCQKLNSNITIDVGHNELAASAVLKMFENKKINLIYGSYKDKNYSKILEILKPIIDKLFIIEICDEPRMESYKNIEQCANKLDIVVSHSLDLHTNEQYLVFGSFRVVEYFLKSNRDVF